MTKTSWPGAATGGRSYVVLIAIFGLALFVGSFVPLFEREVRRFRSSAVPRFSYLLSEYMDGR
jgi:hypothetical protein